MHGIVVKGLKDYVVREYDWPTWRTIQDRADVERRLYTPVARYPDRHGLELAEATKAVTGADEEELAFGAGRHLAPTLLAVFGGQVASVDSGLDVLAGSESVIAGVARSERFPDVDPPDVAGEWVDEETVRLRYGGNYCAGLRGLVVGLGEHFDETYAVTERTCAGAGGDSMGGGGHGEGERGDVRVGRRERDRGGECERGGTRHCEFDVRRSAGTSPEGATAGAN